MVDQKWSELTDEEIAEKLEKISKIVYSNNGPLARQAYPIYLQLLDEQSARVSQKFEEHLKNNGVEMDQIINIG